MVGKAILPLLLLASPALAVDAICSFSATSVVDLKAISAHFSLPLEDIEGREFRGQHVQPINSSYQAEIVAVYEKVKPQGTRFDRFGRFTLALKVQQLQDSQVTAIRAMRSDWTEQIQSLTLNEKSPFYGKPVALTKDNALDILGSLLGELNARRYMVSATTGVDIPDLETAVIGRAGKSVEELIAAGALSPDALESVTVSCGVDLRPNPPR